MSHYNFQLGNITIGSAIFLGFLNLFPIITLAGTFQAGGSDVTGFEPILANDFFRSDDLSTSNLVSQLIVTEQQFTALNETYFEVAQVTQPSANNSSISIQSVISSFGRLKLDARANNKEVKAVPVLPQTELSNVYQGIYDFGNTTSEDLSQPLDSGIIAPPPVSYRVSQPRTVGTRTIGVASPSPETIESLSLPRFGGALPVIAGTQASGPTALRQANLPSARRTQATNWGDSQVDIFFASLPKDEVGDIDTFLRTAYRTSPSEILKRLKSSLQLEVKTQFRTMPTEVFANPERKLNNNWHDRL
ncbi:hypothetical protein [Aphanothece sacrum]|uniref:Uncharacterized protein n=1 Tax=Aphanothece sacrum FPU1 TaxID=1920663 RepID=A0A401IKX0_APHSA|nr:hypothetical protein [Aphanothece sacrum]GBF81885.1 hypothetical protein AsFPU1_3307 [Aphanothece sacrum FPU1]GBF83514.1 hypothetical protein AsFPU3_0556 [Aphanothece sacrum FPU3]